jgi:hypothetical protein
VSVWRPIVDRADVVNHPGNLVVGWWFGDRDIGISWEMDADPNNECATHWLALPEGPQS